MVEFNHLNNILTVIIARCYVLIKYYIQMRAEFLFCSIKALKENTTLQNKPKDKGKDNKHSKSATERTKETQNT
jgi:hypothetical protein